jgi:hypothetical protein
MDALLADRAEQEAGEAAVPARSDDEEVAGDVSESPLPMLPVTETPLRMNERAALPVARCPFSAGLLSVSTS